MAITIISQPAAKSRLSDNLDFVFNIDSIGDANNKRMMSYKVVQQTTGGDIDLTENYEYINPKAIGNIRMNIRGEARRLLNLDLPTFNASPGFVSGELTSNRILLKIKYRELNVSAFTLQETQVGSEATSGVITVYNSAEFVTESDAIGNANIMTSRPCLIQCSEEMEDWLMVNGQVVCEITGYNGLTEYGTKMTFTGTTGQLRAFAIGSKSVLQSNLWTNGLTHYRADFKIGGSVIKKSTYVISLDKIEAVNVIFVESQGYFSSIDFDRMSLGNASAKITLKGKYRTEGNAASGRLKGGFNVAGVVGQKTYTLEKIVESSDENDRWIYEFMKSKFHAITIGGKSIRATVSGGAQSSAVKNSEFIFSCQITLMTHEEPISVEI